VVNRVPRFAGEREKATQRYWSDIQRHKLYVSEHGQDLPDVRDWQWKAEEVAE